MMSLTRARFLIDALQFSLRLDLLRLEAADAGGFLEDHAAVFVGGLQQDIDLALGDDAQVVVAGAGAEEKVLDVLSRAIWPLMRYSPSLVR